MILGNKETKRGVGTVNPIVIGGCPGSGKTTVSKKLAASINGSVVIETDQFFDFLNNPIDPSTPAAKTQNETVIQAYAAAANVYRMAGHTVILEGVIGPWVLPMLSKTIGRFHYILLHTTLDSALSRVARRKSKTISPGSVRRMHPQFQKVIDSYRVHTIDTASDSIPAIVDKARRKLNEKSVEIQLGYDVE